MFYWNMVIQSRDGKVTIKDLIFIDEIKGLIWERDGNEIKT